MRRRQAPWRGGQSSLQPTVSSGRGRGPRHYHYHCDIIATNPFLLGVLLLHVAGNHQTGVRADKLDLFSAVDNHQVAVNDVVAPSVRGQTAGAIRLDRIGSGPIWGLS